MRKMRIALGSNNGEDIFPAHMGTADYFYIYDIFENGEYRFIEKRRNTSPEEEGKHGLVKKMKVAVEIFKDADIILGRRNSPNFKRISAETKYQPIVIKINKISSIIEKLKELFDEIYNLIKQRKEGNKIDRIPIIDE